MRIVRCGLLLPMLSGLSVSWSTFVSVYLSDDALFHTILSNRAHVLYTYLSERPEIAYSLRTRNHNKFLIPRTLMNISNGNSGISQRFCVCVCLFVCHKSACYRNAFTDRASDLGDRHFIIKSLYKNLY